MNKRQKKASVMMAAALVAAASLTGCRIREDEIRRMAEYQVHFDAQFWSVWICLDDRLIGFYNDAWLRFERLIVRIPPGTYNAYMVDDHLELVRGEQRFRIPVFGDLPTWWRANNFEGSPVFVYEREDE